MANLNPLQLTKHRLVQAWRANADMEKIVELTEAFRRAKKRAKLFCACGCKTRVSKPGSRSQVCALIYRRKQKLQIT